MPSTREVELTAAGNRKRLIALAVFALALTGAFSPFLVSLARFAAGEELHSHLLLVPFVSAWLLWINRERLGVAFRTSLAGAVLFLIPGVLALAAVAGGWIASLSANDAYTLHTASYLCFLLSGSFLILGSGLMRRAAFPAFFLVFMIPLPDAAVVGIEQGLMAASADATDWLFSLTGTPVFRMGQVFRLPGFSLEVAQECSGIRSSWVLLITGLLVAYLFLETNWRRAIVVALVIPLGILRNGLRVVVIGLLCVHYGPHMIDSWIHRHGGPLFFVLTLGPLVLLLWWLRWSERRRLRSASGSKEETVP